MKGANSSAHSWHLARIPLYPSTRPNMRQGAGAQDQECRSTFKVFADVTWPRERLQTNRNYSSTPQDLLANVSSSSLAHCDLNRVKSKIVENAPMRHATTKRPKSPKLYSYTIPNVLYNLQL
ncbi:uncharacterized protein EAE97_000447 [Botrytis byssoidea]|uniref:Uncharacterized protein n=1 Tax=Botrytis byssoidea TaxID=139641 RepID=A0A9P5IYT8_9HELO|nr:uncharacterized protein EAE97_000447 [Botrytis byssoidea]KAF7955188.1 hypothetical protein EAE97_000447 [Botrytis byssoidea]